MAAERLNRVFQTEPIKALGKNSSLGTHLLQIPFITKLRMNDSNAKIN